MSDVTAYGRNEPERVGPDRVSPLEERRQRAREAFADSLDESAHVAGWPTAVNISTRRLRALNDAIETATRVRITPEIAAAARGPVPMHDDGTATARAVLEAAGFEVEE